jgi:isopenicillin-N N-acyltransferase-like protein
MNRETQVRVIECGGTAYEIGRQYGEACADSFQKASDFFFSALSRGVYKATKGEVIDHAAKAFLENVKSFDADAIEMIKGQADGAGLDFREAFALQCMIEVSFNYSQIAAMCTSFAVTGKATENGLTILGQNIDWHPDTSLDLLRIKHADGTKQFSICLAGNAYYHLNSNGFGNCANLTLSPPRKQTTNIPLGIYLPTAMRQRSLEDALKVLEETARGFGYYHLANTEGKMVGIESVADNMSLLQPKEDVIVHANHYEDEVFKKVDLAHLYLPCTYARGSRLKQLVENDYGALTPDMMMGFLSDHDGEQNSICKHVDESKQREQASESRGSFVMVPAERVVYVSQVTPCQNKFIECQI